MHKSGRITAGGKRVRTGAFVLSVVFVTVVVFSWAELRRPLVPGAAAEDFKVEPGVSFLSIAERLEERGIVGSAFFLRAAARARGADRRVRYGTYRLGPGMSAWEVLDALYAGKVAEIEVTIPEGTDIFGLAGKLEAAGVLEARAFLRAARDRSVLARFGITGESAEGYCFPDTYRFALDIPPAKVLATMVGRFRERIGPLLRGATIPPPLVDDRDVLTLASIVEQEARLPEERPLIAGVYLNRLRRGMRLEADPTAVYGRNTVSRRVTAEDVRRTSPYNTYRIHGLPPGPIANPGEAAVKAVLEPAATSALYFVARGDGSHIFSRSYRDHRRAIRSVRRRQGR